MRTLILVLLTGAYLCLATLVAVVLWRSVGGAGAGVAGGIATLGLAYAFQGLIARALDSAALRGEIGALREAHLILAAQIEKIDGRLTQTMETVTDDAHRLTEELTTEVHHLEDMVQRMSLKLEDNLSYHVEVAAQAAPVEDTLASRQSAALLETVRD